MKEKSIVDAAPREGLVAKLAARAAARKAPPATPPARANKIVRVRLTGEPPEGRKLQAASKRAEVYNAIAARAKRTKDGSVEIAKVQEAFGALAIGGYVQKLCAAGWLVPVVAAAQ